MRSSNKRFSKKSSLGIGMIEVLIVTIIIGILSTTLFRYMSPQLAKSRDSKRKSDLDKFKLAMENYYNDNQCYPDADILNTCYGDDLRPYMHSIPCDPSNGEPYVYLPASNQCKGYRILTRLENRKDSVINQVKCGAGCGGIPASHDAYDRRFEYVYGVSVGVPVSAYSSLEEGFGCSGSSGTCTSCQMSTGECSLYPMVYPSLNECMADDFGCG